MGLRDSWGGFAPTAPACTYLQNSPAADQRHIQLLVTAVTTSIVLCRGQVRKLRHPARFRLRGNGSVSGASAHATQARLGLSRRHDAAERAVTKRGENSCWHERHSGRPDWKSPLWGSALARSVKVMSPRPKPAVLNGALDLGVTLIDTAASYGL